MAEIGKKVEGEYLQYQGKPLVREGNTIIYGDLNHDPYALVLEIMSYKEEAGEKVPDKILVQIVDAKDPTKKNVVFKMKFNTAKDTASPKVGSQEVRAGRTFIVKTQTFECSGTIRYVEIGE